MKSEPESQVPTVDNSGGILAFPAALAQEGFWFLDQLAPNNPALNVAVRFRLTGPLQPNLVTRALNEIVQRHEILRTELKEESGNLLQVVLPVLEIEVPLIDLSHLPEAERKVEVERQGSVEAVAIFDLKKAPLIRANLLRLFADEHILQITVHHAVSDGWSIGLITNELAAIYTALLAGTKPDVPELPIQFGDFTVWHHEHLRTPAVAAQLAYWKERLKDFVEFIPPTDNPRPPVKTWAGDIVSLLLSQPLTDRLNEIARRNGATLSMLFCAAMKVLLYRYTGQTDISIGTPIAGRMRVEVEKLIGVFINTVILRTKLAGNPTFNTVVHSLGETFVEALENQDVPFELVVREVMPSRDLGRNALFQVNFTYQRDFVRPVEFGGVQLTAIPSRPAGAIFDLHFFMVERDGIWRVSCDFNVDLLRRETAVRMLTHFRQLLESAAAAPDSTIDELQITPPEEQQRILKEWNATQRERVGPTTAHQLFEEQVACNPSRRAVEAAGRALSYAELNEASNRLAAHLRSLGAGRGVLVGLCVERSVEMVVGLMGILKSGAAYVPMDPAFPAERLAMMIEDAAMPIIVTQTSLASGLPAHTAKTVLIDKLPTNAAAGAAPASLPDGAQAEDLAYVIFTSGSTGRPKGVQITHRALVNFLHSMRREPGLTADDVLLSVTTLSFDIAGLELHLPLTSGATVVVATRETASDGNLLRRQVEACGATFMQATPVTWRLLLETGWAGSPKLKILIGGEAVPRELVNQLVPRCASLWNMYGPTETTIWSSVGRLEAGDGPVSIGRPIDNTQVYIVSPTLQLQPIGVPGELLIGGEGLARGYLKREELTAEKFIRDPFSQVPGARVYRTGDLARWNADGTIECLGRADHQVKLRGFRIELGDIEAALEKQAAVEQAVVVLREDSPGEKRLIAYVVPSSPPPTSGQLRDHLRGVLPEYMVPGLFVLRDSLPLTPNGKIDRKHLAALETTAAAVPTAVSIAPRNPVETRLVTIFAELLRAPVTSVTDSFFDLGGHSLLAVKLMAEIEREFGVRIPLARLFEAPTIEKLAESLATKPSPSAETEAWNSLVPIRPADNAPTLYLVHGAGGNVLLYRELARELPASIAVMGLQSQGLDGHAEPFTSVDQMAQHYALELLRFQKTGPFHIGGYCMGGIVAYEVARILRGKGREVGMVAMFDTYNLDEVRRSKSSLSRFPIFKQKVAFHFENLRQMKNSERVGYFSEKIRMLAESGQQLVGTRLNNAIGKNKGDRASSGTLATIQSINHQAGWDHTPGSYDGRVVLFKPRKNYDFYPDPNMGWMALAGKRLEIVELSTSPHGMLISPFVAKLAAELTTRILPAAQATPKSAPSQAKHTP